jgi:6-phosphogluconate dehydrogenase (decarboxylating)
MGLNMVTRLVRGGHQIVAYDRSPEAVGRGRGARRTRCASLDALAARSSRRAPSG